MLYKVSDETKSETDRCEYDFQCLNNEKWVTCSIESELTEGALVTKKRRWHYSCKYSLKIGDKFICTCPIRYYLYSHYKV
jgi:hypothetical protein